MAQAAVAWFGEEWDGNGATRDDVARDGVAWRGAHEALLRLAWLEAAQGRTVRELEQLVSGRRPGSLPDDAPEAGAKHHVLRLEVSGEVLATFREAMAKIRRDAGEALDDGATILLLARAVLGGPQDEGRASYQVALTICECCNIGKQQGRGELVEVGPEVVEMATCDAQNIGTVSGRAHVGVDVQSPPDAEVVADARAKACRALELMGYRPSEVKRALLRIREGRETSLEHVIRQALHELAADKHAYPTARAAGRSLAEHAGRCNVVLHGGSPFPQKHQSRELQGFVGELSRSTRNRPCRAWCRRARLRVRIPRG
jgi:hypothetical protein